LEISQAMMVSSLSLNLSIVENLFSKEKRSPEMEVKCGRKYDLYSLRMADIVMVRFSL